MNEQVVVVESIDQILWGEKGVWQVLEWAQEDVSLRWMISMLAVLISFGKAGRDFPTRDPWSDRQLYVNIIACGFFFWSNSDVGCSLFSPSAPMKTVSETKEHTVSVKD